MESIIPSGPLNNDHSKHVDLVKWEGFTHEDNMWESYVNVAETAQQLREEFYSKNPAIEKYVRLGKNKPKEKAKKRKLSKRK